MRGFVLLFTIVALNPCTDVNILAHTWNVSHEPKRCTISMFKIRSSYTHWNSLLYWRIMLFITKLYHRTKYLFNKKKRIENLQWIVIGVRRRSRVRLIPSIETTTKTKDTAETETISPWSSKHSNNTRQYESSSSRPSYVLIVIVGFRALEHLYLSESFLKCCM